MISYISGELEYIGDNYIIVDNGGIGYNIKVSPVTINNIGNRGGIVKVFTYMSVKDDGISLFGFLNMDELDMFNKLITVSGVGPKGALAMLAASTPSEIALAIMTDDIKVLSSGQGIGKKTAQKIVIELRDKINTLDAIDNSMSNTAMNNAMGDERLEAVEALLALGFGRSEAVSTVNKIDSDNIGASEIIKQALKILSR